jgi:hypothetical protein
MYEEEPIDFISLQTSIEDVTHSSTLPDEAATFARTTFGGGIGLSIEEDPGKESGMILYGHPYDVNGRGDIINAPMVRSIDLPVTMTEINAWFEMTVAGNQRLFLVGDHYVLVKASLTDTFAVSLDLTAGQVATDAEVFQGTQPNEFAFVALGSTGAATNYRILNGATGAWTTHATDFADYFKKYRSELYRLRYISGQGWTVAPSSNGGAGATWGAEIVVGDGGSIGTGLEILDDVLYVAKSAGLFSVDVGTTPDDNDLLGGFIRNRRNNMNGKNIFAWKDYIFYPTFDGGLWCRMIDGTVFEMGITNIPGNRSPIRGRVTAMVGDDYWLYAVIRNPLTNTSYLCKAKISDFTDGTNRPIFAWFGALVVWPAGVQINSIWISNIGTSITGNNPTFWAGRSDNKVDYFSLPRNGTDPTQDAADGGTCRAATTSLWYMPETDAGFPYYQKYWDTDAVEGINLLENTRYVDAEYSLDSGASWLTLGRFDNDNQSPLDYTSATGRRLSRRYMMITDAGAFTIVRSINLSYLVRFPDKAKISFTVEASRSTARMQTLERQEPEDIVRAIRFARQSASPVTLKTPYGLVYDVFVKYWKRVNIAAENRREYEWGIQVQCVVKAETGNIGVYDISLYDSGVVYA